MKLIANKLEEMDKYFSTKNDGEKWGMIAVTAGSITFIAYSYFLPYSEGLLEESLKVKAQLEKKIATERTYLSSITAGGDRDYYVKKFNRDIQNKKAKIVSLKETILYIDSNLLKLSDMLFNQKSWATFLNSIAEIAANQKVNLKYLKNHYVDSNGSFGHVLEIELECEGNFKNIVQFTNELEQNTLVTDIYSSSYEKTDKGVTANIQLSVWGINH